MPEPRDACRPVKLPSNETIRVRGARPLNAEETAALGEVVDAARRKLTAEHPPNPAAEALWARVAARCDARGILRRDAAHEAGVRPSVLTRIAQGVMPDGDDLAAIEAWLSGNSPTLNEE